MANRIEMWPLARLVPYDNNSRTHSEEQIQQLMASILEFGFTQPILVDELTGGILAGHARLRAAIRLGLEAVPVIPLGHLSPAQQRAYIIADNKLSQNAGWDDKLLRIEIEALKAEAFDLDLLGFSDTELADLLDDGADRTDGDTDADDAPATPVNPVCRVGDVWTLGLHRLVVGDAGAEGVLAAVMADELADLLLTDPPYNVNYAHSARSRRAARVNGVREKEHNVLEQDDAPPEVYMAFLDRTLPRLAAVLKPNGSFYIFYGLSRQAVWEQALEKAKLFVRCHIIWAKNHFVLTFNRYKQQHEAIFYGHHLGEVNVWYGDNAQSTLWAEKKPIASREHPTMKPVELMERGLVNSTKRGDVVLDPFGGSGSTLIACERMGRRARLIELEPVYGDVILQRWMKFTKRQPTLDGTGQTFSELERERVLTKVAEADLKKPEPAPA